MGSVIPVTGNKPITTPILIKTWTKNINAIPNAKYFLKLLFDNNPILKILKIRSRNSINKNLGGGVGGKDASNENDELLYSIAVYCVENNVCSINSIQSQFALGFNRASRIVTLLENKKIVSPKNGTKPRDILVDLYQLNQIFGVDE